MTDPNHLLNLKLDFNFEGFLISQEGYTYNKSKSTKTYRRYDKTSHERYNLLVFTNTDNGVVLYQDCNNTTEKGSVLDYLMNARKLSFQESINFLEENNGNFKNVHIIATKSNAKKDYKSLISNIQAVDDKTLTYLTQTRGINPHYIKDPSILDNLCYLTIHFKSEENFVEKSSLAFIQKNKDQVHVNYHLKSNSFPNGHFLRSKNQGTWYTTPEKVNQIIIGESGIDLLSFLQYHKTNPKKTLLISSEGTYSPFMSEILRKISPEYKTLKTVLTLDNDIAGRLMSLKWLRDLYGVQINPEVKRNSSTGEKEIILTTEDPSIRNSIIQLSSDPVHLSFPFSVTEKLITTIIKEADLNNTYFKAPPGIFKDWNNAIKQSKGTILSL